MFKAIRNYLHNESGATVIEYVLIASLIAVAIITAIRTAGMNVSGVFTTVGSRLATSGAAGG